MEAPLVSIVLPTYNRASLIAETIESVVDQTYTSWELIITDDGSTDNTAEVVRGFSDPRISYHTFPHSGAFGIARNRGIVLAQGAWIAFLDSDDIWLPHKLESQLHILQQHPGSHFIFNNVTLFGETTVQAPELNDLFDTNLFHTILDEREMVFYPSSLMFKKEVVQQIGLLDQSSPSGADLGFLLRLSLTFKGCFMRERLVKIRKHTHNSSREDTFGYPDSIAHTKNFYQKGALSKKQYQTLTARYHYKMGLALLNNAEPSKAFQNFMQCARQTPMNWKSWIRALQSLGMFLVGKVAGNNVLSRP